MVRILPNEKHHGWRTTQQSSNVSLVETTLSRCSATILNTYVYEALSAITKKASCEALFLMGSVEIVLPARDSARIVNPQIGTAKKWTFLFTSQVFWWKKVKIVVTAVAILRFSYSKFRRTADLAIAYWKKQIVLFEMCFHKLIPTAKGCNMPRIFISLNQLLQISILLHF